MIKSKIFILTMFSLLISGCNKNSSETNVSFSEGGGLTDIEGNTYPSVIIENSILLIKISSKNKETSSDNLISG